MKQRGDGASIPPGEKLRFRITEAKRDDGDFGAQVKMVLEVVDGEYKGETIFDWSKLAQPRTDFVKNLRNKKYDDDEIVEILRQKGYKFEEIDELEEEAKVGETGKLMNIAMASFCGDLEAIDSPGSIEELLSALEGKTFVSITKVRGEGGKYPGITWDMVYPDNTGNAATEDPEA